jgi:hypothetical protein
MQALFVATIILVGLVILVPMMLMVGALFRTVLATFRASEPTPDEFARPGDEEGLVDSLAWTLRWGEVAGADKTESIESMGGPGPTGGP